MGYLHLVRTFLKCCSVLVSYGVEQIALALCTNVLITLYFTAIWWWLSFAKTIIKSVNIRVDNPTLNRNTSITFHIYGMDFNTPELQINNLEELQDKQVNRTSLAPLRTSGSVTAADSNISPQTRWNHSVWLVKACLKVIFCLYVWQVKIKINE